MSKYMGSNIFGWMGPEELQFLYENAAKYKIVVELGSWKGRSTHALLTGNLAQKGGTVYAIDHFKGSEDPLDTGHEEGVLETFKANVGYFPNLTIYVSDSVKAAVLFEDKSVDMIFIDAGHQYHEVIADIKAWLPKVKYLISGHDWQHPPVRDAVHELLGEVSTCATNWYKILGDTTKPSMENKSQIDFFTNKIKNKEIFKFIKFGDGESLCIAGTIGCNCDGHRYSPQLAEKLKKAYEYFSHREDCYVPLFEEQEYFNTFLHRVDKDNSKVVEFFKAIKDSKKKKIYVAPNKLSPIVKMLDADHVIVPENNAFDNYDDTLTLIKGIVSKPGALDSIILFSAGMMSKSLIHELISAPSDILTCIDIGSSFDPIFGQTRTNQITREEMEELYNL